MDLNLHHVRYLIAVVDDGHFGRAAARLYISAPSLSQQIRKLERAVGAELIDRSAHPLRPTPVGRRFLDDARVALAAADRAVAAVDAHLREEKRTLRLGFMTASTGQHSRSMIAALRARMPEAVVNLVELPWPQQSSAVRDGSVDASLVRPPVADTEGLEFDVLRPENRVAVLPADHRLAGRSAIAIGDLDGEVFVDDDEADPAWVRWWACDPRPSGVPVQYGPSVRTIDELLEAVASGEAIALTGEFVADIYRRPDVVFVPVTDVAPCALSLCTRTGDRSTLVVALRRAVRSRE
ncbi:LysR family transcriptional regulator [Tsukamurella spumae]|uniref:LysR family transcriptional regulator n=1 Tax=Tsukamurella spumae TaxID=44753 RepID=UPI0028A7CDE7|nr:LysR substrate-binding domain-containing protein [Tsukamurella spumae]